MHGCFLKNIDFVAQPQPSHKMCAQIIIDVSSKIKFLGAEASCEGPCIVYDPKSRRKDWKICHPTTNEPLSAEELKMHCSGILKHQYQWVGPAFMYKDMRIPIDVFYDLNDMQFVIPGVNPEICRSRVFFRESKKSKTFLFINCCYELYDAASKSTETLVRLNDVSPKYAMTDADMFVDAIMMYKHLINTKALMDDLLTYVKSTKKKLRMTRATDFGKEYDVVKQFLNPVERQEIRKAVNNKRDEVLRAKYLETQMSEVSDAVCDDVLRHRVLDESLDWHKKKWIKDAKLMKFHKALMHVDSTTIKTVLSHWMKVDKRRFMNVFEEAVTKCNVQSIIPFMKACCITYLTPSTSSGKLSWRLRMRFAILSCNPVRDFAFILDTVGAHHVQKLPESLPLIVGLRDAALSSPETNGPPFMDFCVDEWNHHKSVAAQLLKAECLLVCIKLFPSGVLERCAAALEFILHLSLDLSISAPSVMARNRANTIVKWMNVYTLPHDEDGKLLNLYDNCEASFEFPDLRIDAVDWLHVGESKSDVQSLIFRAQNVYKLTCLNRTLVNSLNSKRQRDDEDMMDYDEPMPKRCKTQEESSDSIIDEISDSDVRDIMEGVADIPRLETPTDFDTFVGSVRDKRHEELLGRLNDVVSTCTVLESEVKRLNMLKFLPSEASEPFKTPSIALKQILKERQGVPPPVIPASFDPVTDTREYIVDAVKLELATRRANDAFQSIVCSSVWARKYDPHTYDVYEVKNQWVV